MGQRDTTMAPGVVEILRLCVVVFSGGVGFAIARPMPADRAVVGPFDAPSLGIILGAGVGYVVGGVVARLTSRSLREAEAAVRERSPEQVVAGGVGAVLGVL